MTAVVSVYNGRMWQMVSWHTGATQEALVEQYNDQLRELREAGLTEQAEEVREALRALRDQERAPESSVKVSNSVCPLCTCTLPVLASPVSWLHFHLLLTAQLC